MNEESFEQIVWCIHQAYAVNLGITWCLDAHFPCGEFCPYRESKSYRVRVTSATTDE